MFSRKSLCTIGAACTLLLIGTQAGAHARVVASTPAANATVASPASISVTFSERVAPAFSGLEVVNAAGSTLAVPTTVSQDGRTLSGKPSRPLAAGTYSANWHAASSDGHRMTGVITFTVR